MLQQDHTVQDVCYNLLMTMKLHIIDKSEVMLFHQTNMQHVILHCKKLRQFLACNLRLNVREATSFQVREVQCQRNYVQSWTRLTEHVGY